MNKEQALHRSREVMATQYPTTPGFKTTGTSQQAAAAFASKGENLCASVLRTLQTRGAMTADECAEAIGESVLNIRPRFSQLRAKGKIEDTGVRRPSSSGSPMNVWRAMELL